jgi:hypothetical protein
MDFGGWPKGSWRQAEDPLGVSHELHLDGHRTVVPAPWWRHDPIRDLSLHHHRRVAKPLSLVSGVEQAKQDGGGDVVGKVADDSHGRSLTLQQLKKIDVEEVGLNEAHVLRETRRKRSCKIAVEFDSDDLARALGKRQGQRPAARADLQECFIARGHDRRDQSRHPGRLEEVLTESFPSTWERSNPRPRIPSPGFPSSHQSSSSASVSPRQ